MQLWVVELSLKMLFCKNQKTKQNKINHGMMTVQLKLAVNCSSTDFDHLIFIGFGFRVNSGSLF
jgi:hypothetical protein